MEAQERITEQQEVVEAGEFSPDKADAAIADLAEWLNTRTTTEKAAALVYRWLCDLDVSGALEGSNVYRGDIGEDLADAWLRQVDEAELDDKTRRAFDTAYLLSRVL